MPREADLVAELSTSTGTGSMTLSGATAGHRTWQAAFGESNTSVHYGIVHDGNGTFEIGIGTFLPGSGALQRDLVLASSSGGSKVSFASGSKVVYCQQPAEAPLLVRISRSSDVGLEIIPAASQSAPMMRVQAAGGGDAFTVGPTGKVTTAGGLSFGSTVAPGGVVDLSRHIALYGTSYGFGVTSGALNVVSGGAVDFYPGGLGGAPFARIDGSGRFLGRNTNGLFSMHGWIGMESSGMYRWTDTSIAFAVGGVQTMWMAANTVVVPATATFQALGGARASYIRIGLDGAGIISLQGGTGFLALRAGNDGFVSVQANNGTTYARFDPNGTSSPAAPTVITREKGDARYASISSALRFKESPAEASAVDGFLSLSARRWTWGGELPDDDPRRGRGGYGLIADDVAEVLPEAVIRDGEGRIIGLDPLPLIGALFAEVKAFQA